MMVLIINEKKDINSDFYKIMNNLNWPKEEQDEKNSDSYPFSKFFFVEWRKLPNNLFIKHNEL